MSAGQLPAPPAVDGDTQRRHMALGAAIVRRDTAELGVKRAKAIHRREPTTATNLELLRALQIHRAALAEYERSYLEAFE